MYCSSIHQSSGKDVALIVAYPKRTQKKSNLFVIHGDTDHNKDDNHDIDDVQFCLRK